METQVDGLKVPEPIANLSATFGATIGQNGCAGIYPAMLAVMIALHGHRSPKPLHRAPCCHRRHQFLRYCRGRGRRDLRSAGGSPAMGFPVTVAAVLISWNRSCRAHGPQRKRHYDRRRAHGALAGKGRRGLSKA